MNLVDIDKLGVGRCSKDVLPAAYCAGWNGLLGLLEKAPTVDAVPVSPSVYLDGMEGHEFDSAARRKQPKCRATNRRRN